MKACSWKKISMNTYWSLLWPSLGYKTLITQVVWSGINSPEAKKNEEIHCECLNKYFGKRLGSLGA